jgi:ABC-type oligopeptide transport system substrate-binding subunit
VSKKSGGLLPSPNQEIPAVDAAFAASQKLTGPARNKVLANAQRILMEELPMVPVVEYPTWFAVRKGIGPIEGRPNNTVTYWNLK